MSALASWRFERIGEREISVSCPTFSTPLVLSLDVCDRHLRAFYSLAADLADSRETGARAGVGKPSQNWEGAEEWMPLAWELCANECGEEACTELIWEGGPIPEPWGDRWLKYEDQAKEMIAMVRKLVPVAAAPAAAPAKLEDIEQYRMQMAAISTAALGYWKESDGILPDYDTLALRDVAKLYAKYDTLYKAMAAIADMDPQAQRADDLGRAARIASIALGSIRSAATNAALQAPATVAPAEGA